MQHRLVAVDWLDAIQARLFPVAKKNGLRLWAASVKMAIEVV
jgi:hypothetical protein